jgi:hypothetical protein
LQISVRFLKFIGLHRYPLKLCLMLIVCAMFRLGEPRHLRRPLGLSSPPYRYFLEQIGAGDLRPHRPQPSRRWFSAAGLDGQCLRSFSSSSRSSVQFQVRRNRRPSRSTKLLRPMVDRSSATSWTQRKRSRPPVHAFRLSLPSPQGAQTVPGFRKRALIRLVE